MSARGAAPLPRALHGPLRLAAAALALAAAGCAEIERAGSGPWDPAPVAATPAPEDPLAAALREGYLALAREEFAEGDWNDGSDFLIKAQAAADGAPPPPTGLAEREIPREALRVPLAAAEPELLGLLGSRGAVRRAPEEIARAQIDWECWLQEAEEGVQADQIAACRDAFDASLAAAKEAAGLPKQLVVILPGADGHVGGVVLSRADGEDLVLDTAFAGGAPGGAVAVEESEVEELFSAALAARPVPPAFFEVLFDFGSSRIDAEGAAVVERILADMRGREAAEVVLVGHADAVGGAGTNLRLSQRRAARLEAAIRAGLAPGEEARFLREGMGERDPALPSAEAERANRRVEVTVR